MTSESLVSRPFSGKFCLARYKGKWSRVEVRSESLKCTSLKSFKFFKTLKVLGYCNVDQIVSDNIYCSCFEITNMYGNRVMEILFIDFGVPATVEVTDLREIPPVLNKDLIIIPPQVSCLCVCVYCGSRYILIFSQSSG